MLGGGPARSCSPFSESLQFLGDTLTVPECFIHLGKHQEDGHTQEHSSRCVQELLTTAWLGKAQKPPDVTNENPPGADTC